METSPNEKNQHLLSNINHGNKGDLYTVIRVLLLKVVSIITLTSYCGNNTIIITLSDFSILE